MNIIPFRGLLPDLAAIPDPFSFFEAVKEDYLQFHRQDYFLSPEPPSFYVFRMQNAQLQATGLICTTHIDDYLQGKVLKHEDTIPAKELIQVKLLKERQAAVKPVLLVHRHQEAIRQWLMAFTSRHQPTLAVKFADQEEHSLWQISASDDIKEIRQLFREKLSLVAIADGHHRFSSFAALYRGSGPDHNQYASVLTAYFPEDELQIEAFHRLIQLPHNRAEQQLLENLRRKGTLRLRPAFQLPAHKHQMSIYVCSSARCYDFTWDHRLLSAETQQMPLLDVHLLQDEIINPWLEDPEFQPNPPIKYIENTEDLLASLGINTPGICFILYPIDPVDFLQIVKSGISLVPKATFFQPRLKNGLVVQPLY